ncbi:anhydro-N-acetylmuramic acid kinase [mine drainage metagenome]|uniref:Anhydro-N-acetylmuramic acid kinase n=1 Tax=mine drainage metagenome TaxID=410659 RepID=A0A1J5R951_9ZZZZ
MAESELIVGLMSGTSLDGVDAALVEFSGTAPVVVATAYLPYPDELRKRALSLHEEQLGELHLASVLANDLTLLYAQVVAAVLAQGAVPAAAIRAIGCHGQTIRHRPSQGYSIQVNNPALLAELTGISVVADFRSRDIAAGGQGAPLVPGFHDTLFRHEARHRVILNIGGIANLTDLAPGKPTKGFDCGPGNLLLDAWIRRHLAQPFDEGGRWAEAGHILPGLLERMLTHDFFGQAPPKSCGREQFDLAWLHTCLAGDEDPADVQATLAALTATAAQLAIEQQCSGAEELYVCGGGARNATLVRELERLLPETRVSTTEELGLPADWVEAVAFAWLAQRTLQRLPGNLPQVTGARGPRVLGAVYPA